MKDAKRNCAHKSVVSATIMYTLGWWFDACCSVGLLVLFYFLFVENVNVHQLIEDNQIAYFEHQW